MHLETTPAALIQVDAERAGFPDIREGSYAVGDPLGCGTCGEQHTITGVIATAVAHNITIIN